MLEKSAHCLWCGAVIVDSDMAENSLAVAVLSRVIPQQMDGVPQMLDCDGSPEHLKCKKLADVH